jgi:hypothetical protein
MRSREEDERLEVEDDECLWWWQMRTEISAGNEVEVEASVARRVSSELCVGGQFQWDGSEGERRDICAGK